MNAEIRERQILDGLAGIVRLIHAAEREQGEKSPKISLTFEVEVRGETENWQVTFERVIAEEPTDQFELDTSDVEEPDWESAIEQCDTILGKCEDLPERADDFRDSIEDKVGSIREWIEEHEKVTADQQRALDNMESGVDRWLD